MNGFQTQVSTQPAPAVAGDFCDSNPRFSYDAGPGGLVSGLSGVTVGRFAWANMSALDADSAPAVVNSFGSGPVSGFVHREQQALIVTYLADASLNIAQGFAMTLMAGGGFWVKNEGATAALQGQKAYAAFANGAASFAATGSAATASITASIAAETSGFTASLNNNVLSVSAVSSGTLYNGTVIAGTNVATGTQIVSQLTSTASGGALGSTGTYAVSIPNQAAVSEAMTGSYGLMTVTAIGSGVIAVGAAVGGASAGTVVTAQLTGSAGGTGTYIVNLTQTFGSGTLTPTENVETKWYAASNAPPGGLVKMVSNPPG